MPDLRLLPAAVKELGVRSLLQYGAYEVALRSGWIRRQTPSSRWGDHALRDWLVGETSVDQVLQNRERFFFEPHVDLTADLGEFRRLGARPAPEEAEAILGGAFRPFQGERVSLGFPPDWNHPLPVDGEASDAPLAADRHWSSYALGGTRDFKLVWELSRFGWIYPLARAYRATGDERYWEGCLALLGSWMEANPPNTGPQWISAQEVAIRLLALTFAWYAFAPALGANEAAAERLALALAIHAARIPPTLTYAKAQRNNHLLVEAVGLYTAGTLFPHLCLSQRWRALGRRLFLSALADQVFPDGGYIQHSSNYQRMALQAGIWVAALAELHGQPLPIEARRALERLAGCLQAIIDCEDGQALNFGHNDGSQILPLSNCAFGDFRPTLQAAALLFRGQPAYPQGPWDEFAYWIGCHRRGEPPNELTKAKRIDFPQAGLYPLQGQRSRAMLRCAHFSSRPAHSDQLHFDLCWDGRHLAIDPGSYRYAAPPPWDNALARASAHNAALVDGVEPMRRGGRFLWLDWAQGELLGRLRSAQGGLELLTATHDGYRSMGIEYRRAVLRAGEDLWLVVDDLAGARRHRARCAWTLPDWKWALTAHELVLDGPQGEVKVVLEPESAKISLVRGGRRLAGDDPDEPLDTLGWYSPTYAELQPALCLLVNVESELPLRMVTWWCLGEADPSELELGWRSPEGRIPPFDSVIWRGERLPL